MSDTPTKSWSVETIELINALTPNIKSKSFDPDWFLLRQRLERFEQQLSAMTKERDELKIELARENEEARDLIKTLHELMISGEKRGAAKCNEELLATQAERDALVKDAESYEKHVCDVIKERNDLRDKLNKEGIGRRQFFTDLVNAKAQLSATQAELRQCAEALENSMSFCSDIDCAYNQPHSPNCGIAQRESALNNPITKEMLKK